MNSYGMIVASEALRLADERLAGYREEQARHRLAASVRPTGGLIDRISVAVSSIRATVSVVDTDTSLPSLNDYPYRS